METTGTTASPTTHVVAEDAPLGVQLWPTRLPEYAPNFTLEEVSVHRSDNGEWVAWRYRNGTTRTFRKGEKVVVQFAGATR